MKLSLTPLQRTALANVAKHEAASQGGWYRAGGNHEEQHVRGEAVTLASLHTRGLLVRRAWRGQEGERSAAYEYRLADQVRALIAEAYPHLKLVLAKHAQGA